MERREQILKQFEDFRAFTEDKIFHGIEENRKKHAFLKIRKADGTIPEDAEIHVRQLDHEFRFGANLFMLNQLETAEKNRQYEDRFRELFNMATLPFYWDTLEPEYGKPRYAADSPAIYRRPPIDACLAYCEANGIEPREHALAYTHFFPKWMHGADIPTVKREMERRFSEIAERYSHRIPTIEVTNELFWESNKISFYRDPDFLLWCYRTAEKYFPHNELVINEAAHIWEQHMQTLAPYYQMIENTRLKGGRIDAIGMQFHMFFRREQEAEHTRPFYDPRNLYAIMDTYARQYLPLQITEVTVPAYTDAPEDEALQAEILTWLYSIWFSHPNMEQIVYWNLVDGYAHAAQPGDMNAGENYYRGGLLRFDHSPKPSYEALHRLIHKEWHTDTCVRAQNGAASFKGFCGRYQLTVRAGGQVCEREIRLTRAGEKNFEIIL